MFRRLVRNKKLLVITVATLSGFTLGAPVWLPEWWFLSLVSFGGVMYVVQTVSKTALRPWLFFVGFVTYGCTFGPLYWSTLPLDWLGISGITGLVLIASIWVLTVGIFSLVVSFLLSLVRFWQLSVRQSLVAIPSLYVLADTLGTFIFSVVLAGPASTIGFDFTMGSPGYHLAESVWLRQGAWVGGIFALLWIQAFVGMLGYFAWYVRHQYRWWPMVVYGLLLVVVASNPTFVPDTHEAVLKTIQVGVLSTYTSEYVSASMTEQIEHALSRASTATEIVALPEDRRYLQNLDEEQVRRLQEHFTNAYILDSGTVRTAAGLQPEIQQYHTASASMATSSKQFLMIFGEYLPWLYRGIGYMFGLQSVIAELDADHRYVTEASRPFVAGDTPIAVRLCSDAMSPTLYAADAADGAGILFNLASHGWFHQSQALHELALRVGQVRAVEAGRWYVRAGNDSPAVVIDQSGAIVAAQQWYRIEPLVVSVPVYQQRTPYTIIGVGILLLPLICITWLYYRQRCARLSANCSTQGE
jgi:apolipoprotein N-acyltransferase